MARGQGLGVRRHDRARGLEPDRQAARGAAIRILAPRADGRRARPGDGNAGGPRRARRRAGRLEPLMSSVANDETRTLEAAADAAIRAGRGEEAVRYLSRLLEINGSHPGALEALGQHAFRRGDLAAARSFYERLGA